MMISVMLNRFQLMFKDPLANLRVSHHLYHLVAHEGEEDLLDSVYQEEVVEVVFEEEEVAEVEEEVAEVVVEVAEAVVSLEADPN